MKTYKNALLIALIALFAAVLFSMATPAGIASADCKGKNCPPAAEQHKNDGKKNDEHKDDHKDEKTSPAPTDNHKNDDKTTVGGTKSDPDDNGKGPDRGNGGPDIDKDKKNDNGSGNDDDCEDDNEGRGVPGHCKDKEKEKPCEKEDEDRDEGGKCHPKPKPCKDNDTRPECHKPPKPCPDGWTRNNKGECVPPKPPCITCVITTTVTTTTPIQKPVIRVGVSNPNGATLEFLKEYGVEGSLMFESKDTYFEFDLKDTVYAFDWRDKAPGVDGLSYLGLKMIYVEGQEGRVELLFKDGMLQVVSAYGINASQLAR